MSIERPDDLLSVLGGSNGSDTALLQGVVTAWNGSTHANTVELAGGVKLHDLPIIGATEVSEISVNSIVALLRWKSRYYILGIIIRP